MIATSLNNWKGKALLPLRRGAKADHILPFPAPESAEPARVDAEVQSAITGIEQQVSASGLDSKTSLGLLAQCTLGLMGASGVAIALLEGDAAVCRARAGAAPEVGTRLEQDRGISGECLRSGRIVRCADTAQDARVDEAACQALNLRSAVALPIVLGGMTSGVFAVFWATANAVDDGDLGALSQIVRLAARVVVGTHSNIAEELHTEKTSSPKAPQAKPMAQERARHALTTAKRLVLSRYVQTLTLLAAMAVTFVIGVRPKDTAPTAPAAQSDPAALRIIPPGEQAITFAPPADEPQNAAPPALTVIPSVNPRPQRIAKPPSRAATDVTTRIRTAAPARAAESPSAAVAPPAITFAERNPALGGLITPPVPAAKLSAPAAVVAPLADTNKAIGSNPSKSSKRKGLHRIFGGAKNARPRRNLQKSEAEAEDSPAPSPR